MALTFKMTDGDLFFDVNGRLRPIAGFEKVSQDLAEVLLTDYDSDRDYGSELPDVDTVPTYNVSSSQVTVAVSDAIERLRSLQRTNVTTTTDEEIASVDSIEVIKNDRSSIVFGVAVSTTSGAQLTTSAQIRAAASLNQLYPPETAQTVQKATVKGVTE